MCSFKLMPGILIILISAVQVGYGADITEKEIKDFKVEQGSFFGLCGNIEVPCGYFMVNGDHSTNPNTKVKKTSLSHGTVREVLNAVVKNNPDYQWSNEDGVINIVPKQNHKHLEKGADPLSRIIKKVEVSSVGADEAAQRIAIASGLPLGGRIIVSGRRHSATVSFKLSKVTLRQALNALVKADGMAVWVLEYDQMHNKYIISVYPWRKGWTAPFCLNRISVSLG